MGHLLSYCCWLLSTVPGIFISKLSKLLLFVFVLLYSPPFLLEITNIFSPYFLFYYSAFTITYTIQANWLVERTSIASNLKLNQNGRILFVLMEGNGPWPFNGGSQTHIGCIQYALKWICNILIRSWICSLWFFFSSPSFQLLAMIGEQFDHGDEICGAVVNVRARQDKISIWTKNATNEAAQVIVVKMN